MRQPAAQADLFVVAGLVFEALADSYFLVKTLDEFSSFHDTAHAGVCPGCGSCSQATLRKFRLYC